MVIHSTHTIKSLFRCPHRRNTSKTRSKLEGGGVAAVGVMLGLGVGGGRGGGGGGGDGGGKGGGVWVTGQVLAMI